MTSEKKGLEAQAFDPSKCYVPGCQNRWTVHMHGEKPMCSMHSERGISPSDRLLRQAEKPFMEVDKDHDL